MTKFDFLHYSYKYCFKCLPSSFRFLKNVSFTRIFAPVLCIFRQICLVNSATEWNVLKLRRLIQEGVYLLQIICCKWNIMCQLSFEKLSID